MSEDTKEGVASETTTNPGYYYCSYCPEGTISDVKRYNRVTNVTSLYAECSQCGWRSSWYFNIYHGPNGAPKWSTPPRGFGIPPRDAGN